MRTRSRRRSHGASGPLIVCAQVGNVNTGAVDPLGAIADICERHGAWLHVDGAFGLWASASPTRRPLVAGVERADSWATDGHKWLNVPYDCGIAVVADREAHRGAMGVVASYLQQTEDAALRDPVDWNPEFSRRARGLPVYAALRQLGRSGVAELVDRLCACSERFAERLAGVPGIEVLAQGLNQTLIGFDPGRRRDAVVAALDARRHLPDDRDHLARAPLPADLVQQLEDDRRGRRPVGGALRARRRRYGVNLTVSTSPSAIT